MVEVNDVKINMKDIADIKGTIKEHTQILKNLEDAQDKQEQRSNRHSQRIDKLEEAKATLQADIKEAVSEGMEPILSKLKEHDDKFKDLTIEKEREAKEKALSALNDQKEMKKWFSRTVMSAAIGVVVGPIITLIVYALLNARG